MPANCLNCTTDLLGIFTKGVWTWMILGPFQSHVAFFEPLNVFLQKYLKNQKEFCWHWSNNKQQPNWQQSIESPRPGIQLLPASLLASSCTAKPLNFCFSNGLMVYTHARYEKNEDKKAVPKHFNGSEPATSRGSPRIDLNRCAAEPRTASEPLHY